MRRILAAGLALAILAIPVTASARGEQRIHGGGHGGGHGFHSGGGFHGGGFRGGHRGGFGAPGYGYGYGYHRHHRHHIIGRILRNL